MRQAVCIFADEGYLTWQKNLVEPYLKQCQKYAYFHSYDGAAIFYQQYLAAGRIPVL